MADGGFTESENDWIAAFGKAEKRAVEAAKTIQNRQDGQKLAADLIDKDGDMLRKGLTFEVTMLPKGLKGQFKKLFNIKDTMTSLDPDKGPLIELDTWHDLPAAEPMDEAEVKKIQATFQKIIDVQDKMKKKMDADGFPLFRPLTPEEEEKKFGFKKEREELRNKLKGEPEEKLKEKLAEFDEKAEKAVKQYNDEANRRLSEDLWEPLKREGIVPENLIPDAYSEVARVSKGAMEAYKERLDEYSEGRTKTQQILDDLGPGFEVADKLLTATADAAGGVAGIEGLGDTAKEVKQIATLLKVTTASVHTGAKKIINERDVLGSAEAAVPALTGIIDSAAGPQMAAMVGSITASSIKAAKVGEKLAKKPPKYDEALEALGAAIGGGLGATGDPALAVIGSSIARGCSGLKSSSVIAKAIAKGDSKEIIKAFETELTAQFGKVKGIVSEEITKNIKGAIESKVTDPDEKKKLLAALSKDGAKMVGDKEIISGLGDLGRVIDDLVNKPIRESATKQAKAAAEAERERVQKLAQEAAREFDKMLPVDDEAMERAQAVKDQSVNNIKALIATVKRDQMIFDLAKKIATGSTAMVAAFVPAAGIAPVATQLIFSITEAVERARHVEKWRRNVRDSENAKSVLADAAYNEFYYQVSQEVELNIKIGLQATQLLAKAVETAALASGLGAPAAAAGAAVAGAAAAAQSLLSVAVTVKTTAEMAKAWSLYKKAAATPEDRKAVRKAIRANPTLAKYAMAYGAVTDKNPVAVICMKRCGLNEKTLANPTTNVGNVVEYLETVYRDDPVLLRAVTKPQKWHPGEVELTAVSYSKFCMKAFSKAKPPVRRDEDNTVVNASLMVIEELPDEIRACFLESYVITNKEDLKAISDARDAAQNVVRAIDKYKPKDPDGNAHKEMLSYLETLSAQAQLAARNAKSVLDARGG